MITLRAVSALGRCLLFVLVVLVLGGCWSFRSLDPGVDAARDDEFGPGDASHDDTTATDGAGPASDGGGVPRQDVPGLLDGGGSLDVAPDLPSLPLAVTCADGASIPAQPIDGRVSITHGVAHPWTAFISMDGPKLATWADDMSSNTLLSHEFPTTATSIALGLDPDVMAPDDRVVGAITDGDRGAVWRTLDAETRSAGPSEGARLATVVASGRSTSVYATWFEASSGELLRISDTEGSQAVDLCGPDCDDAQVALRPSGGHLVQARHPDGSLYAWDVRNDGPGIFAVPNETSPDEYDTATLVYVRQHESSPSVLNEAYRLLRIEGAKLSMREFALEGELTPTDTPTATQTIRPGGYRIVGTRTPVEASGLRTYGVVASDDSLWIAGWDGNGNPLPPMVHDVNAHVTALSAAMDTRGEGVYVAWVQDDGTVWATVCAE